MYKSWRFSRQQCLIELVLMTVVILRFVLYISSGIFGGKSKQKYRSSHAHKNVRNVYSWLIGCSPPIWLKSDLYLRHKLEDMITLHYWSSSSEHCICLLHHDFVFKIKCIVSSYIVVTCTCHLASVGMTSGM